MIPESASYIAGTSRASGHIVHFEFLLQWIEESVGNRLNGIHRFQIGCQIFVPVGHQKLCKGHGVDLHEIDLADREGVCISYGYP